MLYFKELHDLPIYENLLSELSKIDVHWKDNQISINTIKGKENDYTIGTGSLIYNWDDKKVIKTQFGNEKVYVSKFDNPLQEHDFTVICNQFKGTAFEEIYNELNKKYILGRVRLMKSKSKTCLSWHTDTTPRVHYPIKTQEGCLMIINDEVKHLEQNKWYYTSTVVPHTAVNASNEDRVHLVVVIIDER